ncbi:hypothetical protein [Luteimonas sp. SDU101]|uniref:hypothetical protein n=1 Tax=Luteimonas sp. SDU101 TaxID=3422593 RepID=UPI003EBF5193
MASIISVRLVRIVKERTMSQVPRSGCGPEFLGEAFVQCARSHGMVVQDGQPGEPNQNA